MMLRRAVSVLSILAALSTLSCSGSGGLGSSDTGSVDPSVSDPTTDVAANAGPASEFVSDDSFTAINAINSDIYDIVTTALPGAGDSNPGTCGINCVDLQRNVITEETATIDVATLNQLQPYQECVGGGSRNFSGTLTMTVPTNGDTITISGNLAILYTDCVDVVSLSTSDGTCVPQLLLNGTLEHSVDMKIFSLNQFDSNPDTEVTVTASTVEPIEFAIGDGSTQTIDFDIDYFLSATLSSEAVDGTFDFESHKYSIPDVKNFIADSTSTAEVCP